MARIFAASSIGVLIAAIPAGYNLATLRQEFSNQAWNAYLGYYPNGARNDDNWDAFRHAYTSARFQQIFGDSAAQFLGDVNETLGRNDSNERNMDYYNNDRGREVGSSHPKIESSILDQNIAADIYNRIQNGNLITDFNNDPRAQNYDAIHDPYGLDWDGLQEWWDQLGEDIGDYFSGFWDWADRNMGSPNGEGGEGAGPGSDAQDANGDGRADAPLPNSCPIPTKTPDQQASPLVLDLDGDGVEHYAAGAYGTYFDLRNNGQAVLTGWVAPDDGLLAIDANGNGRIDNGNELFGSSTTDGFTVLKNHDSNNDNVINVSDTNFNALRVWRDTNSDGFSQSTELKTLTELGITSINLNARRTAGEVVNGNTITHTATFTMGSTIKQVADVWFGYSPLQTKNATDYLFDIRAAYLPTLKGAGDRAFLN